MSRRIHFVCLMIMLVAARPSSLWSEATDMNGWDEGPGSVLEIGPFHEPDAEISSMGTDFVESRKKERFRVLYRGVPLQGANVAVTTDDGWEETETTDEMGIVTILPVESAEGSGRLLLSVSHRDPSTGEVHDAGLMVHVFTPVSGWKDRVRVFALYAFGAVCLSVLFVLYRINGRRKRDHKIMLEFEKHKIHEATP